MNEVNNQLQDAKVAKRIVTHGVISNKLALLSDQRLTELIKDAKRIGTTIGGTAAILTVDDVNIFIKKIRLTDIERQPENRMSTANVFDLPLYYQYGLGSAGFGVWRELAVHTMSTQWVLSGECVNFPMMYHWRLLPKSILEVTTEELKELECDVEFWAGSPAVRERLLANMRASAEIVLFLEYIPENLHQWLSKQISNGDNATESACKMVEDNLNSVISFINSRGLLHFDAHFFNILTEGDCLYFADFGLAIGNQFDLSEDELDFFNRHQNYDQCYSMAYFIEWLLANLFGIENWVIGSDNPILLEYAAGKGKPLSPFIELIVMRYLPIAVVMNDFFKKLKKSKTTPYPVNELECALAAMNIKETLTWVTNILKKHNIPFQIAGGLAMQAYGSTRKLIDIDIDIPEDDFEKIKSEVAPFITFGPDHFKSENWDLFLLTLNYHGQEIDLGGAYNAKIYDKTNQTWVKIMTDFSKVNYIDMYGLNLPVIGREELIAYKKILARPVDLLDLEYLER